MEWVGSSLCGENVGVYLISGGMPDQEEVMWAGHTVGGVQCPHVTGLCVP